MSAPAARVNAGNRPVKTQSEGQQGSKFDLDTTRTHVVNLYASVLATAGSVSTTLSPYTLILLIFLFLPLNSYGVIPSNHRLFGLHNGINEFEVVYSDKQYYLFHHDFNVQKTYVRRAHSINNLRHAKDFSVLPGLYPTVIVDHGKWHAWVWDGAATIHYVAPSWHGPYVKVGPVNISTATDWQVRQSPRDGWYYATYKGIHSLRAGIARSPNLDGPWQNLGDVFSPVQRATWHATEEADPAVFFYRGRAYMTFAGWQDISFALDSGEQVLGIVELDLQTMKAIDTGKILLRPTKPWQHRGGGRRIFNPIFLAIPGQLVRIFYAVNPSAKGINAGWGYIASPILPKNTGK